MAIPQKSGILLLNIGTPSSPEPSDVGAYLTEFLSDPYVIDIPAWVRWFLVNVVIVPKRKFASAKLYQKIWREDGSPLSHYMKSLVVALRESIGDSVPVVMAMRYGNPPIADALRSLRSAGVEHVRLVPLYPQFAAASTTSSVEKVKDELAKLNWRPSIDVIPPFYSHPAFLDAFEEVGRTYVQGFNWDAVLFSFHGLPKRQIKKVDTVRELCFKQDNCCDAVSKANEHCYRAQCFATARALAARFGIPAEKYRVGFQSRLGQTEWIRPYTDDWYSTFPKYGVRRLLVFCPSFVSDCLETLEEIAIRGNDAFRAVGGEAIQLVPSLNASPTWVKGLKEICLKG